MDENETLVGRNYISTAVDKALDRNGVDPLTSPLKQLLVDECVIIDVPRDHVVRARGGEMSLDDRISELKRDPKFAAEFPPPLKKVGRGNTQQLRDNFEAIAKGTVVVE